MNLFARNFGAEGKPLVILHGLFGQSDNWTSLARQWSSAFRVFTIDQRNHGQSAHRPEMSYPLMAADLYETINALGLDRICLIGHSMGGKTAMQFALNHPERIEKMLIADIGPRFYAPHHQQIIEGLEAVQPESLPDRATAETRLQTFVPDFGTRQFLLKNLVRREEGGFAWRFNLEAIKTHISEIGKALEPEICDTETLFVRGGKSRYILDTDWPSIQAQFPNAQLETIEAAGHWLHAEQPAAFSAIVTEFFS